VVNFYLKFNLGDGEIAFRSQMTMNAEVKVTSDELHQVTMKRKEGLE